MWYYLLTIVLLGTTLTHEQGNYWREFTGTIPEDAITGGTDINGRNVYIGQAYIPNKGLIVVELYPGKRQLEAPAFGVQKGEFYAKILSGSQEKFIWTPANSTNLHLVLIYYDAVIGGHKDGANVSYIGRVSYEGNIKIGKIVVFGESAWLYFVHRDKEVSTNSYEILVFKNKCWM